MVNIIKFIITIKNNIGTIKLNSKIQLNEYSIQN